MASVLIVYSAIGTPRGCPYVTRMRTNYRAIPRLMPGNFIGVVSCYDNATKTVRMNGSLAKAEICWRNMALVTHEQP